MPQTLLIVEDEGPLRESLQRIFRKDGFAVDAVGTAEQAIELLEDSLYDVVVTDIMLPRMDGIELLGRIRAGRPDQICIVVTAYASIETAVKALRAGAYDYIMKPIIHEEIKQVVRNALTQRKLQTENALLRREVERSYDFRSIIGGESGALRPTMDEVRKIADTKSNVLLLGETGTGKELLARVIHASSSRRDMPFLPINCSAIPENLIESELFGHVRGAFTGAVATKKGLLEEADGGTVFLDEIAELAPAVQAKLLRVLEDEEIRPVGGTRSTKVSLRYLAATNRDLAGAIRTGSFREDLFYRINVITLRIPPLRERRADLPALIEHFMGRYARDYGRRIEGISPTALSLMTSYAWPGNIRELQNVIERAVLVSEGPVVGPEHLPEGMRGLRGVFDEQVARGASAEDYMRAFVRRYEADRTENEIAGMLGITRKTLWEKRRKWGMKRPASPGTSRGDG